MVSARVDAAAAASWIFHRASAAVARIVRGLKRRAEPSIFGAQVDSAALCDALRDDCEAAGCVVAVGHDVHGFDGAFVDAVADGERLQIDTRSVVNCAGLRAPRLAAALGLAAPPPTLLARGSYFGLRGPSPFRRLVYPLPVAGGLGVHATVDLAGRARFGPDVEWLPDGADPDDPRLWDVDPERAGPFYAAIRSYYPGLRDGALYADYAGARPKLSRTRTADFELARSKNAIHLVGIESPGLTASLALAEEAADAVLAGLAAA
mmetsp:Transcript_30/g.100  ORF Transcript_30/g.100 Transcript_30/m.100 type:complete len:264 (-) Transcript_30:24-815(-)